MPIIEHYFKLFLKKEKGMDLIHLLVKSSDALSSNNYVLKIWMEDKTELFTYFQKGVLCKAWFALINIAIYRTFQKVMLVFAAQNRDTL